MINFIMKHKILVVILASILLIGGPEVINILFKIYCKNELFIAEWDAGDALSYYGSVMVGIVTLYLAYVAIKQSEYANKVNEKLMNIEQIDKKAYLKLNLSNSSVELREDNMMMLNLEFENVTNNIIIDSQICGSKKLLTETVWKIDKQNDNGSVSTKVYSACTEGLINDCNKISYSIVVRRLSVFMLISFMIKIKDIYGFETIQYFNIFMTDLKFNGYKTECLT